MADSNALYRKWKKYETEGGPYFNHPEHAQDIRIYFDQVHLSFFALKEGHEWEFLDEPAFYAALEEIELDEVDENGEDKQVLRRALELYFNVFGTTAFEDKDKQRGGKMSDIIDYLTDKYYLIAMIGIAIDKENSGDDT